MDKTDTQNLIEFSLWLDLLALCFKAGLDFNTALKELIALKEASFVSQNFSLLLSKIQLGHPKQLALEQFQKAWSNHPLIETFCHSLLFGFEQGIALSSLLQQQASLIRQQCQVQMEKEIHTKQLKLLLPLFLMILPAVILVLITPLFIQLGGNL